MANIAYRHPPGIQADNHRIQTIEAPLPFTHQVSSPGFCVGIFRPLSFVLLCICFLLVAV